MNRMAKTFFIDNTTAFWWCSGMLIINHNRFTNTNSWVLYSILQTHTHTLNTQTGFQMLQGTLETIHNWRHTTFITISINKYCMIMSLFFLCCYSQPLAPEQWVGFFICIFYKSTCDFCFVLCIWLKKCALCVKDTCAVMCSCASRLDS